MRWEDIKDGEWTIPSNKREKSTAGSLVLPVKFWNHQRATALR